MSWSRLTIIAAFFLSGCQAALDRPGHAPMQVAAAPAWHDVAFSEDIEHIERVDAAWDEGLRAARADGFARRIAAEGALLDPMSALPRPAPSPGAYLCRLIRLGASDPREPAFVSYRPFYCFVGVGGGGDRLSITKSEGSQRPAGYLWDDDDRTRMVFLGTLAPGRGPVSAYGDDRALDIAGVLERVGPFRYRLVIPWPRSGAAIEIFEMVPAPVQASE